MVELNGMKWEREQMYSFDRFAYATLIIDDVGFVASFFFQKKKSVKENTFACSVSWSYLLSPHFISYIMITTLKKDIYEEAFLYLNAFYFYNSNFLSFSNQK